MKFCSRPFRHFEITPGGRVYACCSGWMPVIVGHFGHQSISEIWNGEPVKAIRKAVGSGDMSQCTACPYLANGTGPVIEVQAMSAQDRSLVELGTEAPEYINLAYDRTCNLSCPSCRQGVIVETGAQHNQNEFLTYKLLSDPLFCKVRELWITGSGDPFASQTYRNLMRNMPDAEFPKIALHTNGLLFTKGWAELPKHVQNRVVRVEVSIDAGCAETYAINRRGGDWNALMQNLSLIALLRCKSEAFAWFKISFVMQSNNWREMEAFAQLGYSYGADEINFTPLRDWGTFSALDLKNRKVHHPSHPEYPEFVAMCQHVASTYPRAQVNYR